MITNVYVDGFNLYFGCLKGSPYKWLNVERLCQFHFPADQIQTIHYFTALVKSSNKNPHKENRQKSYLRALQSLACVQVHLGHFLKNDVSMPLANPPRDGGAMVTVVKNEEKGSDVNLASMMLLDAFDNKFEQAIVITNDSDQCKPIEIVRTRFKKPVIVLIPSSGERRVSYHLSQVASSSPFISMDNLKKSQFSKVMTDAKGEFNKPREWGS